MDILPKVYLDSLEIVNPVRFSGCLWRMFMVMLNSEVVYLNIIVKKKIEWYIVWHTSLFLILTVLLFFYMATFNITNRKKFGRIYSVLNILLLGPWAISGDFSEILHPHEKIGATIGNSSRMQNFADFINRCGFRFLWTSLYLI